MIKIEVTQVNKTVKVELSGNLSTDYDEDYKRIKELIDLCFDRLKEKEE